MEVGVSVQTDASAESARIASVDRSGRPRSMKEMAETHRLVMTSYENGVEGELYHFPVDGTPLAALTQVMFISS